RGRCAAPQTRRLAPSGTDHRLARLRPRCGPLPRPAGSPRAPRRRRPGHAQCDDHPPGCTGSPGGARARRSVHPRGGSMSALAYDVVGSSRARAAWACAEPRPTTPHLLPRALDDITSVVEFPAGPGHFLTAYARAGVRVRLIDASWPMLTAATHHACDVGVVELAIGCHFLEHLPDLAEGLMVVPNAALNQLATQTPLTDVLAHLREAVHPGTRLFLQYLQVGPTPNSEP